MLSVVTVSRDRPVAFSLLEKWMRRQTLQPTQWLVVHDSSLPYAFTMNQEVIHRTPRNGERHSFIENWLAALPAIQYERVLVMEDDDFYAPNYIETMNGMFEKGGELVGISGDLFYNIAARRFTKLLNRDFAALAGTGFHKYLLPFVKLLLERGGVGIDYPLWREWETGKLLTTTMYRGMPLRVGIKGMPGPQNLGVGRDPSRWSHDPAGVILRQWVGRAAQEYMQIASTNNKTRR